MHAGVEDTKRGVLYTTSINSLVSLFTVKLLRKSINEPLHTSFGRQLECKDLTLHSTMYSIQICIQWVDLCVYILALPCVLQFTRDRSDSLNVLLWFGFQLTYTNFAHLLPTLILP